MYDFHIITIITSLSGEGVKYYLLDLFLQEVPAYPPLLAEYIWQIWGGIPPIFHFFQPFPHTEARRQQQGSLPGLGALVTALVLLGWGGGAVAPTRSFP